MTRKAHDQLAKRLLKMLLAPCGRVELEREITSEVQAADVWFQPTPPGGSRRPLGLLGALVSRPCVLEIFRNSPSADDLRACMLKLLALHREQLRKGAAPKLTLAALITLCC